MGMKVTVAKTNEVSAFFKLQGKKKKETWRFSELLLVFITVLNLPEKFKLGFLGKAVKATLEIGQTPNSMCNIPKE